MRLERKQGVLWSGLLATLPVALAAMLLLSALRTYQALDEQKAVYLRSRAAALAARLETLDTIPEKDWETVLGGEEPALAALALPERSASPELAALWEGRELYRLESHHIDGAPVLRAFIPFHHQGELRVARIDMSATAADFLVEHAQHHLLLVGLGGAMIVVLSSWSARSQRRAAAAEKRQIELEHLAHIGEMSAVLAHEIRNPLGTIKGYAQLLGERLAGEHAGMLAPILAESARLESLSQDLLLYGRPAEPRLESIRSDSIAGLVVRHTGLPAVSNETRFEHDVPEFTLETDPQMLEQILLNLLRNAFDAVRGRPGARVRFEAQSAPDAVVFRILDNGPGISPEAAGRLFEPFYTTKAAGTGLGLCVSRKLARALGGDLSIRNLDGGETSGVEAVVRLPRRRAAVES